MEGPQEKHQHASGGGEREEKAGEEALLWFLWKELARQGKAGLRL